MLSGEIFFVLNERTTKFMAFNQGRSQKWPMEGVMRPEIAKKGGFEGAEALRIRTRASFF